MIKKKKNKRALGPTAPLSAHCCFHRATSPTSPLRAHWPTDSTGPLLSHTMLCARRVHSDRLAGLATQKRSSRSLLLIISGAWAGVVSTGFNHQPKSSPQP